jgi:hypothetical protein
MGYWNRSIIFKGDFMTTHWNYRLCKQTISKHITYSFREVYYDDNKIVSYSFLEHNPLIYTLEEYECEDEARSNLKYNLQKIIECMEKPVVDLDEVDKTFKK